MTNKEVSDRKFKLQARLEVLKQNEDVQAYIRWKKLPQAIKNDLTVKWTEYYKACRLTDSYERYQTVRDAFKQGDFSKVKRISSMGREDLDHSRDPVKPSSRDPQGFFYESKCQDYDTIMEELETLNKVTSYDRAEEIFA